MDRKMLRDDQWARIEQLLPGKRNDPGCTAKDNRRFVEAVLWLCVPAVRDGICRKN
jgi:transposase